MKKTNSLFKQIVAWLGFAVLLLTFVTLISDLPEKVKQIINPKHLVSPLSQEQVQFWNSDTELLIKIDLKNKSADQSAAIIQELINKAKLADDNELAKCLETASTSNNLTLAFLCYDNAVLKLKQREATLDKQVTELKTEKIKLLNVVERISTQTNQNSESSEKITGLILSVLFDFDSADIPKSETATMNRIEKILNTFPDALITISAHTSNVGHFEFNYYLGERRLISVMQYLIEQGIDPQRFYNPISYGDLRPVANNRTPEGRKKNNRIEFSLYFSGNMPPIPDGSMIKSIQINDQGYVIINGNGALQFKKSLMTEPPRLILDIPYTILSQDTITDTPHGNVKGIRTGFNSVDNFTRIVIDLNIQKEPVITQGGRQIIINPN